MSVSVSGADSSYEWTTSSTITNNLPEGDTVFTPPAGMTSTGADSRDEIFASNTITTNLPEGSYTFKRPAGISFGSVDSGATTEVGISATGGVSASDGSSISATAYLRRRGKTIGSSGLGPGGLFEIHAIPWGIENGEDLDPSAGDTELLIAAESGGVASKQFSGLVVESFATFAPLTITILDAVGNGVGGDSITVDNAATGTTSSDGVVTMYTSGSVTVTALDGSKSLSVDMNGTAQSVTFQYAGIEGTISTPRGSAIEGKTIKALDAECNTLLSTTTDESGHYGLYTLPVDTEIHVVNDPLFRKAATNGMGTVTERSFPSLIMQRGDPCGASETVNADDYAQFAVECIDTDTGEPAAAVPVEVGGYQTISNASGIAYGIAETGTTVAVTVGANDRYRRQRIEYDVTGSESLTVELTRFTESSQV